MSIFEHVANMATSTDRYIINTAQAVIDDYFEHRNIDALEYQYRALEHMANANGCNACWYAIGEIRGLIFAIRAGRDLHYWQ